MASKQAGFLPHRFTLISLNFMTYYSSKLTSSLVDDTLYVSFMGLLSLFMLLVRNMSGRQARFKPSTD